MNMIKVDIVNYVIFIVSARDDTSIDAQLAVYKPNNFNLWKNSGVQHCVRTVQ